MARLYMMNVNKFERTEYGSFSWDSELSVILDSNGTVLGSVCTTYDGTETVNFEDIKNDFGVEINEGNVSVDDDILTDIRFDKLNTILNADQILFGEDNGEVIKFIPLLEEEFFAGTSLQKAS